MSETPTENQDQTLTLTEIEPVEVDHSLLLAGRTLDYTTTTGYMPLKNEKDEIQAQMFFMAYTLIGEGDDRAERPLTFVFNGGPGSSSIWLHLGTCGPFRAVMQDEGWLPEPPYRMEANDHTWLDWTDLVFIDPVGTGFSHAKDEETAKTYWSLEGDLDAVAEFIRLYLTRYKRWSSPLFLAGESYGTTRAAGLTNKLLGKGIGLNGVILISTVLNFQTIRFTQGNDLPPLLYIPTYAVTARYHERLDDDLQAMPLEDFIAEVETWTEEVYVIALTKGDRLQGEARQAIVEQLARYTGLSPAYIDGTNLRINIQRFCKELLRDERRTVGRLDSRFKGIDALPITELPDVDPSMAAIIPPYTAMFNDYVRRVLKFETDREYQVLSFAVNQAWEWERGEFPDTSEMLRGAMARNPYMKVYVGRGLYDLATPFFAAQYTLNHMDVDPALRDNVQYFDYPAGHMYYIQTGSLAQFKADVMAFIEDALPS